MKAKGNEPDSLQDILSRPNVEQYRAAMFNCNLALVLHPNGATPEEIQERIDRYNKAHNERGGFLPPTQEELDET